MTFTDLSRAWRAPAHRIADDHRALLLCHGISGSPQGLRAWGEHHAARGWDVSIPLLPGHATAWRDLGGVSWGDWLDTVRRAARELVERHGSVSIGGLSMGGALALALAEDPELGRHVDALVLVNPAVRLPLAERAALPLLSRVVPSIAGIASDIRLPGAHEEAYARLSVRGAEQLRRLQAHVRPRLSEVRCPVLIATSPSDHVVDPVSSDLVAARVTGRVSRMMLHRSFHVATLDHDAPALFERSARFLESRGTKPSA